MLSVRLQPSGQIHWLNPDHIIEVWVEDGLTHILLSDGQLYKVSNSARSVAQAARLQLGRAGPEAPAQGEQSEEEKH